MALESTVKSWFSQYYEQIWCSDIYENLGTIRISHADFKFDFILEIQIPSGAREQNFASKNLDF